MYSLKYISSLIDMDPNARVRSVPILKEVQPQKAEDEEGEEEERSLCCGCVMPIIYFSALFYFIWWVIWGRIVSPSIEPPG